MKLYNTLNKKIEDFIPNDGNNVKLYTCGPTVYYFAHIGNLRTYLYEDILEKTLVFNGYNVKRVMNITDVGHLVDDSDTGEDKMATGARREHKTVWEIAAYYTDAFFKDCTKLNIEKPEIVEKASDHIDKYIEIINKLLDDKIAYISEGNVYFDVSKANNYYQLSGKEDNELIVGVRDTVEEDDAKKNPGDFGLWFTNSKFTNQIMQWDSPWGRGYPGWHIECSGLALEYLGNKLDIHCGGVDNIFPHHSNEIAQSEAFTGSKWCNYWLHGEHLNDQSGKMSKSNGEFLTIDRLVSEGYNPLAYRYLCLQSHYRRQLVFTYESLDTATSAYNKLLNKVRSLVNDNVLDEEIYNRYHQRFKEAISNDLNTANGLTTLYDLLKEDTSTHTKLELIKAFDKVLSLDLLKEVTISDEISKYALKEIEKRNIAKANKDFTLADQIRDSLKEQGIIIKDTKEGTIFEIIK